MKAIIFDHHTNLDSAPNSNLIPNRAEHMKEALYSSGWECNIFSQVYVVGGNGCLLSDEVTGLKYCQLVMLHLGNTSGCGNEKSWEYLQQSLVPLGKKICLIAYSGGSCQKPVGFEAYENDCPWIYFNGVKGPQDIHLKEFAEAWNTSGKMPSLQLLRPDPRIGALKLLILGYQVAHGCGSVNKIAHLGCSNPTEVRSFTESLEYWLPVRGKDMSSAPALNDAVIDGQLKSIVNDFAAFDFPLSSKFPSGLHQKLCNFPLGAT